MNPKAKYSMFVTWSDTDKVYIGRCPELFGGGCHGEDPKAVFNELYEIVEEWLDIFEQDGTPLPDPLGYYKVDELLDRAVQSQKKRRRSAA